MAGGVKFGYKASAEQFAPRELLSFGVAAEEVGFDSVFVSDHFQPWRHSSGHAPFSLVWLGALGERTRRVEIGTSVLTPTFRYHPAVIAQAFGTLGCLFPGRVVLGVGTGEAMNETALQAMEWPAFKERFARLKEAVELIRLLWREEKVIYQGTYYRTRDVTVYDRPDVEIPVYVAAGGRTVAEYAGQTADGMICTSGKGMGLYQDVLLPALDKGVLEVSRGRSDVSRVLEVKVSFDEDWSRAQEDTRFWAPLALSAEEKAGTEDPATLEALGDALPLDRVARRWIVSSDADEHVERVSEYVAMGFDHLIFHAPGPDQMRFLSQYGKVVLPKLRRRWSAGE